MHAVQFCSPRYYTGPVSSSDISPEPSRGLPGAAGGWREEKKRKTRRAIHRAALELVLDEDAGQVTVEEIARRAGVSPRTFFNYFSAKEEALGGTGSGLAELLATAFRQRPPEESTVDSWRAVFLAHVAELTRDRDLWALRRQAAERSPELRATLLGAGVRFERTLLDAALDRDGPVTGELRAMVESFAAIGALRGALWRHARLAVQPDGDGSLAADIDEAFALLGAHPAAPRESSPTAGR